MKRCLGLGIGLCLVLALFVGCAQLLGGGTTKQLPAPDNPSPADGDNAVAIPGSGFLTLSWDPVIDPSGGTVTYSVKFGKDNLPATSVRSDSASWTTLTALVPGSTYVWKVVAKTSSLSKEGPIWSFKTAATAGNSYTLTPGTVLNGTMTPPSAVTVNAGVATSITATPGTGFIFSGWAALPANAATFASASSASTTVTLSGNATITPTFTANAISYTLSPGAALNGTMTPASPLTVNAGTATAITATPSNGFVFSGWVATPSGNASFANPSSTSTFVTLTGDATITPAFSASGATYTLSPGAATNGSMTPSAPMTVNAGTATPISATPVMNYSFAGWTATPNAFASFANASSASTTVILSGDVTITPTFISTASTFTLTPGNSANGSMTPITVETVNAGAATSITAMPATGYYFAGWTALPSNSASFASISSASTTVTLLGNATIMPTFELESYALTPGTPSNGTMTPSAEQQVNAFAATPITATPSNGFVFAGWVAMPSDNASFTSSSSASTSVTLTGDATITPTFSANGASYTLTPGAAINGSMTPITVKMVNAGVATPITATPSNGFVFAGWVATPSDNASFTSPSSASTSITLTGDATITPTFTANSASFDLLGTWDYQDDLTQNYSMVISANSISFTGIYGSGVFSIVSLDTANRVLVGKITSHTDTAQIGNFHKITWTAPANDTTTIQIFEPGSSVDEALTQPVYDLAQNGIYLNIAIGGLITGIQ